MFVHVWHHNVIVYLIVTNIPHLVDQVAYAAVDCTVHSAVCNQYDVHG